ncbi:methyl-accepting chemotaxis protein [Clostridium oceanicum]|uniref:Methyl-accepting chemotaxis protein n=2 Tax=Clostridium oceanicum TaxID=1543 RepID=A0ABP3UUW3_9CLOT
MKLMKKLNSSIRYKIMLAITICCLLTSFLIGSISILKSKSVIQKEAEARLTDISQNKSNNINELLLNTENTAKNVESLLVSGFNIDKAISSPKYMKSYYNSVDPFIKNIAKRENKTLGICLIFNPQITKNLYQVCYEGTSKNRDFKKLNKFKIDDFKETNEYMSWYYNPSKSKKAIWSDPHEDAKEKNNSLKKDMRIAYTKPIYKNNKLIAVLAIDLYFNDYVKMINNVKVYNNGYAFLLNKNFEFLVYKNSKSKDNLKNFKDSKLKSITKDMVKNKTGIGYYTLNGNKNILGYSRLSNGNIMVVTAKTSDIFKSLTKLQIFIITFVIFLIILFSIIAWFIGKKLSDPITLTTKLIKKTGDLDLSYDKNFDILLKYKDECGIISKEVFNLRNILSEIIKVLKNNSEETSKYSTVLSSSTNEISKSSQQISTTVIELAKGAQEQACSAEKSVDKLEHFSKELDTIIKSIKVIQDYSTTTNNINNNSINSFNELLQRIKLNDTLGQKTSKSVDVLSEKSKTIVGIIDTIHSIAKQTNLLALNAAIEAQRAGEAGKGFSVVAEEIRKLSNETTDSTKKIENIIYEIQNEVNTTKYNMDQVINASNKASEAMEISKEDFKKINSVILKSLDKINNLANNVTSINKDKNEILNSIHEISAVSEESAACTEEISSSIDEQSMNSQEISKTANNLEDLVNKLKEIIMKFNID